MKLVRLLGTSICREGHLHVAFEADDGRIYHSEVDLSNLAECSAPIDPIAEAHFRQLACMVEDAEMMH